MDAYFRSYLAHPTGLRVASLCLFVSGALTTLVYAALHARPGALGASPRTWALALGVVSGIATTGPPELREPRTYASTDSYGAKSAGW